MSSHLSIEALVDAIESIDAIDARASSAAARHLESCEACRMKLASLRETLEAARQVEVPEPSPLFWDHFSARVTEATREASPSPDPWWHALWRPGLLAGGALAAMAVMLMMRAEPPTGPVPETATAAVSAPVIAPMTDDDGTWGLVEGLAAGLEWRDVHQAAEPAVGAADAAIEELSAAQRDALARLLQREMGDF